MNKVVEVASIHYENQAKSTLCTFKRAEAANWHMLFTYLGSKYKFVNVVTEHGAC